MSLTNITYFLHSGATVPNRFRPGISQPHDISSLTGFPAAFFGRLDNLGRWRYGNIDAAIVRCSRSAWRFGIPPSPFVSYALILIVIYGGDPCLHIERNISTLGDPTFLVRACRAPAAR